MLPLYSKKSDYMINSIGHRKRIRLWQALCLLVKFASPEIAADINTRIWPIVDTANLLSVRRYMNIFTINLLANFTEFVVPHLSNHLKQVNTKADSIASGIVIAGHVLLARQLPEDVVGQLLTCLIQYCTSNHITIRTISQSMIHILAQQKDHLVQLQPIEQARAPLGLFPLLQALDTYVTTNIECSKTLEKQHAHISGQIDPHTACTFENLFYYIPILEQLTHADIIHPSRFSLSFPAGEQPQSNAAASTATPEGTLVGEPAGFQKKILPWENMDLFLDDDTSRSNTRARKRQSLILVATLIDKIPNLAGMARTSEIFNIESLVIPNKKVEKDELFQQISVTAEKWVPLVEVKEDSLMKYLLEKKAEGYTLLGVEQTSHSVSLPDFVFPKKAVLLMGR